MELPATTGGSEAQQNGGWSTTSPAEPVPVPSPGNMYSESGEKISLPESRIGHIFRDAEGHIPDTPQNRELLIELANDKFSILGPDRHGTVWSAKILSDGAQSWVQTRNGVIINGGINAEPKSYDPERSLASLKPRGRNDGK